MGPSRTEVGPRPLTWPLPPGPPCNSSWWLVAVTAYGYRYQLGLGIAHLGFVADTRLVVADYGIRYLLGLGLGFMLGRLWVWNALRPGNWRSWGGQVPGSRRRKGRRDGPVGHSSLGRAGIGAPHHGPGAEVLQDALARFPNRVLQLQRRTGW